MGVRTAAVHAVVRHVVVKSWYSFAPFVVRIECGVRRCGESDLEPVVSVQQKGNITSSTFVIMSSPSVLVQPRRHWTTATACQPCFPRSTVRWSQPPRSAIDLQLRTSSSHCQSNAERKTHTPRARRGTAHSHHNTVHSSPTPDTAPQTQQRQTNEDNEDRQTHKRRRDTGSLTWQSARSGEKRSSCRRLVCTNIL